MNGEGPAARAWADERLTTALSENGPALIRRIESEASAEREGSEGSTGSTRRGTLDGLLTFLRPNRDRMWYA